MKAKDRLANLETKSDSVLTRLVASKWTFIITVAVLLGGLVVCWVLH